jgi:uncharacterized membrane protein
LIPPLHTALDALNTRLHVNIIDVYLSYYLFLRNAFLKTKHFTILRRFAEFVFVLLTVKRRRGKSTGLIRYGMQFTQNCVHTFVWVMSISYSNSLTLCMHVCLFICQYFLQNTIKILLYSNVTL